MGMKISGGSQRPLTTLFYSSDGGAVGRLSGVPSQKYPRHTSTRREKSNISAGRKLEFFFYRGFIFYLDLFFGRAAL